jgi:hypothetical protein
MIPFKGRIFFRQYIPRKPHSTGIKYWAIVDEFGYLYGFEIYVGTKERKKNKNKSQSQLASKVIQKLISQVSRNLLFLKIFSYQ